MAERSVFDMIGPIMIGPSSSHTAGCARLARTARLLLCGPPTFATITFYNSFAHTYQGHGSDCAVIGGLLGYKADDLRIREALNQSSKEGLSYYFKTAEHALHYHPNTVQFVIENKENKIQMLGVSSGGGKILIQEINDFSTNFSASLPTLVLFSSDVRGVIAYVSSVLSEASCNIATMTVDRRARNNDTCFVVEMDHSPPEKILAKLEKSARITQSILLPSICE